MFMESRILLDNATLSSVQRALGYIQVKNPCVFDLEITNLSNLCDAVLFNEEVYIPHNVYISEFIDDRKDLFSSIGIQDLVINEDDKREINKIAMNQFSRWCFNYVDDQNGLFNKIMELMDIYMKFVWNYRSSEYWLVMRAFQSYEGNVNYAGLPIFESLISESNTKIWEVYNKSKNSEIVDSMGRILNENSMQEGYKEKKGPRKMMAAMSWNICRAMYYRILAASNNCIYFPHSLRGVGSVLDSITLEDKYINEDTLKKYGFPNSSKTITDSLNEILKSQKSELLEIGAVKCDSTFSIPPILGYVLSKSKYKEDFFEILLKLKNDSKIINLRNELREFEESIQNGDVNRKWKRKLEKTSDAVKKELGLQKNILNVNPLTYLSGGGINETGLAVPIPKFLNRIVANPSNWSLWYREVAINLSNVSRLGKEYEKLKSWAKFETTDSNNYYNRMDYPNKFTHILKKGMK